MKPKLNRLKLWFGLLLSSYFLIGIGSHFLLHREVFPIFSWFLFSRTPNQVTRFTIIIFKHNDNILDPPVLFNEAPQSIASSRDINANITINNFGFAYVQNHRERIDEKQKLVEDAYLNGEVEYGLVRETYDPYEKYKFGLVEREVLAIFLSE